MRGNAGRVLGVGAAAALAAVALCGCTSAQSQAIAHAFAPPPVDLRAVPGGLEIGLACGAAAPQAWILDAVDQSGKRVGPMTSVTYPPGGKPTRTVVVSVPEIKRHADAGGLLMVNPGTGLMLSSYAFDFRYDKLPTDKPLRIPGQACPKSR